MANEQERFEAKVWKGDRCWEWMAATDGSGYGQFRAYGKGVRAHRFAYSLWVGEIPQGAQVLHRCDNRICVRPEHLFLGDNAANVADKMAKGRHPNTLKEFCVHGHPFADENTYYIGTMRGCRTCRRITSRLFARTKRARRMR